MHDILEWCNKYLYIGSSQNSTIRHFIYLVEENNILSRYDHDTISGSTKWHSFRSSYSNTWTIWTRELAYFCQFYLAGEWEECENIEWVEDCKQKSLAPTDTHFQDDIVNKVQNVTFASEDYGHISDLIQPRMHNLIKFCCVHDSIYIIYLCTHVIKVFIFFILSCRTCLCCYFT